MSAQSSTSPVITVRTFARRFRATRHAAQQARKFAVEQLRTWNVPDGPAGDIAAVVAELAANAAVHGRVPGRDFRLVLYRCRGYIRVEVTDTKTERRPAPDRSNEVAADSECGRGLLIVAALATRWGVTDRAPSPGKTVWAEVGVVERAEGGSHG
jgi:anti-sigma regulatory factor (Ser/Thr protein kinase)